MVKLHIIDMMLFYTTEVDKDKGHKRLPHSEFANLKYSIRRQDMEKAQPGCPLGEQRV